MTECKRTTFEFPGFNARKVTASFDGGAISYDGGGLLLGRVEQITGIIRQFADCFIDHRNPRLVEHTLYELIRVYGLALGYPYRTIFEQAYENLRRREPISQRC